MALISSAPRPPFSFSPLSSSLTNSLALDFMQENPVGPDCDGLTQAYTIMPKNAQKNNLPFQVTLCSDFLKDMAKAANPTTDSLPSKLWSGLTALEAKLFGYLQKTPIDVTLLGERVMLHEISILLFGLSHYSHSVYTCTYRVCSSG
jgi:hypothetical protein